MKNTYEYLYSEQRSGIAESGPGFAHTLVLAESIDYGDGSAG